MMGRTHATSAAALWLAGCSAAPLVDLHPDVVTVAVGTAVCAVAAYLPDIDHRSSKAARCGGPVTYVIACVVARSCARIHAATKTRLDRPDIDGHRTCTHSLAFTALAGAVTAAVLALAGFPSWAWLGFPVTAGCVAHCLGDALTNSGCPMLWPLKIAGRRWYPVSPPRAWRFGTNGPVERLLVVPLLAVATVWFGWLAMWPSR